MSSSENSGNFIWTDQSAIMLSDICINYRRKNGRNQSFKWRELHKDFETISKRKCSEKSLKNKYDALKKEWRLWKQLKGSETGLGWNASTGTLSCSDERWERKKEENPKVEKFRTKPMNAVLEEKLDELFLDAVANGQGCVAPSIDLSHLHSGYETLETNGEKDEEEANNEGLNLEDDANFQFSPPSRLAALEREESTFFRSFTEAIQTPVQGIQIPTQEQSGRDRVDTQPQRSDARTTMKAFNSTQTKRTKKNHRQEPWSAKLSADISTLVQVCSRALDQNTDTTPSKVATTMSIISRMETSCVASCGVLQRT